MYLWTRHIIYSVVHDLSEIQTDSQVLCQSFIYRQSLDKDAQLRIDHMLLDVITRKMFITQL